MEIDSDAISFSELITLERVSVFGRITRWVNRKHKIYTLFIVFDPTFVAFFNLEKILTIARNFKEKSLNST